MVTTTSSSISVKPPLINVFFMTALRKDQGPQG